MIFWLLLIIIVYLVYILVIKPMQYWKKLKVPYVTPVPLFGNSFKLLLKRQSMAENIQDLYNSHPDARYIGVYQFGRPQLLIKDLELLKKITVKDFDHFTARQKVMSDDAEPLFSKNLLSLSGDKWRHTRATLSPTFTGNKMRAMFALKKECAEQYIKHLQNALKVNGDKPKEYEMKDLFSRFACDVIASTAFGIKCDSFENDNDFFTLSQKATQFSGVKTILKFIGYSLAKPLMKFFKITVFSEEVYQFFKNIVVTNIKEREENNIVRPDMIHLLMEARKGKLRHEDNSKNNDDVDDTGFATVEESDVGKNERLAEIDLSDDDILAHTFIFFLAGFEGSSSLMAHMAYELGINQDVQKRLQEEIDSTLEECDGNITYEKLMRMKYFDMAFCEVLRKWSNPVVDRQCTATYTIPAEKPGEVSLTLNPDDIVGIPIYAIHRDPKHFPNPDKFDPERFNEENKKNLNPFSYIPFGVGPKNCIGSRFAIMSIKIIIFYFLANFDFVLTEKSEVPLVLTKKSLSLNAQNGFWLGLQKRKKKCD